MTRSRRAGLSRDQARQQPMYARMLGLQYLAPNGLLCFVFLEGAVALGILLALAELVSWWGVLVLPVTVATMVKLNDVVAGALTRPASPVAPSARPATEPPALSYTPAPAPPPYAPVLRSASAEDRLDVALARARTVDLRVPASRGGVATAVDASAMNASAMDASALNGPPLTRHWADELDPRELRARQSAARHYE